MEFELGLICSVSFGFGSGSLVHMFHLLREFILKISEFFGNVSVLCIVVVSFSRVNFVNLLNFAQLFLTGS